MKRVYKSEQEFDHDLYKLEISTIEVNEAAHEGDWKGERYDHKHYYHTFDSAGKKHTHSAPATGHAHEITWDEEGKPICGPAVKQVRVLKRVGNKRRVVKEWRRLPERSQHNHDVSYMYSERLKPRKLNSDAANAMTAKINAESAYSQAPAGVEHGN